MIVHVAQQCVNDAAKSFNMECGPMEIPEKQVFEDRPRVQPAVERVNASKFPNSLGGKYLSLGDLLPSIGKIMGFSDGIGGNPDSIPPRPR
jgi:hypothetical protein